jgi:type IV pilus assembly protein PilA
MIVVAIILIIAAIAIPNLVRARMAANESSAASGVRSITAAELAYASTFPAIGYAAQIQDMGHTVPCTPSPTHACLLDNNLASAFPGSSGHSGYQFLATGINGGTEFVVGTTPLSPNTGSRDFCAITDGVVRAQVTTNGLPVNATGACLAYPIAQ